MTTRKHVAISMTQTQHNRLEALAIRLKMTKSRIVNILVNITYENQILEDLVRRIDNDPRESTTEETHIGVHNLANVYDKALMRLREYVNAEIERMTKRGYDIQRTIEIARTKWVDED